MVLPVVGLPPVMAQPVKTGCSLFDKPCEFRHFQNHLSRLTALESPSTVNVFACIPNITDTINLTCFRRDASRCAEQDSDHYEYHCLSGHHEGMSSYIHGVFSCGHAPDPSWRYQKGKKEVMPARMRLSF